MHRKEERITGVLATYLRLSKEDEDILYERKEESNSIRTQRLLLQGYISQCDDLREYQIMEYVDDGYSGKNFDRPEIKRLLSDVRNNRIQCIMVKDFSRFGRDYVEVGNYIEKVFPFMGIRFIAVNNHFDSITMKAGEVPDMDFSFQNLIYDYYSVENSIKTKKVQEKRRQEGKYMSVYAPYGYLKDPQDNNHLLIDEEAAMHIRDIYAWYLEGKTKAEIARILDARKVLTPAEYMTAKGSNYNWRYKESQGKWCGAIIGRILRNRIYTGTLVSGKTESIEIGGKRVRYKKKEEWCSIKNTHQPIISKELYEEVQNLAINYKGNKNNRGSKSNKNNRSNIGNISIIGNTSNNDNKHNKDNYIREVNDALLIRNLRCGGCKHKLTKRDRLKVSFYCRYYYELHDENCISGNVYQDKIFEVVLDTIKKQVLLAGNSNYLLDMKRHVEQARERAWKNSRRRVEDEMDKLKQDNFRKYILFRTGEMEKERYLAGKQNNEKLIKQLEERYIEYKDNADASHNISERQTFLDVLEPSGNIKSLTKDLIDALIESIEVYPGNRVIIRVKNKSIWSLTPDKRD